MKLRVTRNTGELGAFVRRDLTRDFSLQANFMRKTGGTLLAGKVLPQNMVTIESHLRRGKLLDLRLEAGGSRSDNGLTDSAYRVEARGELPGKLSYAIEHAHAGPDFQGYSSNIDTTYATIGKVITPRFRVHASANYYAGNPALNDILSGNGYVLTEDRRAELMARKRAATEWRLAGDVSLVTLPER